MGNFVHFCDVMALVSIFERILSYRSQRIYSLGLRLTFHIKLVSFKNINILPIYWLKTIKFGVYAHYSNMGI